MLDALGDPIGKGVLKEDKGVTELAFIVWAIVKILTPEKLGEGILYKEKRQRLKLGGSSQVSVLL